MACVVADNIMIALCPLVMGSNPNNFILLSLLYFGWGLLERDFYLYLWVDCDGWCVILVRVAGCGFGSRRFSFKKLMGDLGSLVGSG